MPNETKTGTKTDQLMGLTADIGMLICSVLSGVLLCLATVNWAHIRSSFLFVLILVWCGFLWLRYLHEKREAKWTAWLTFACAFLLTSTALLLALFLVTKSFGQ